MTIQTARVGIIGFPVGHSISTAFQDAAFRALGLDASYERWETSPDQLSSRMASLRVQGVLGANITVPHKEEALGYIDEVEATARRIGAINTVVSRAGRLIGHNTDAEGFLRSLREEAGFDPMGKKVLVLGAGGSARAVAYALADTGAAYIVFLNRTMERGQRLAQEVAGAGVETQALAYNGENSPLIGEPPALLVHCTPLGMRGGPGEGRAPDIRSFLSPATLVYDLVYVPSETPLLRLARQRGARALGGLGMLVRQGAASFRLWTGRQAPVEVMYEAARAALSEEAG